MVIILIIILNLLILHITNLENFNNNEVNLNSVMDVKLKSKFVLRVTFLVIISLILLSPLAMASTGCYVYPSSNNFCTNIEQEVASEDCGWWEDCIMNVHFLSGTDCSELDYCKTIFCKSSCESEYLARCPYGELATENIEEWCQEGCCRFSTDDENYCQVESNQWYCELEAKNNGLDKMEWMAIPVDECESRCDDNLQLRAFTLKENNYMDTLTVDIVEDEDSGDSYVIVETVITEDEEGADKGEDNDSVVAASSDNGFELSQMLILCFFLAFLVIVIFILLRNKRFRSMLPNLFSSGKNKPTRNFNYPIPNEKSGKGVTKKKNWLFGYKGISRRLKIARKKHAIKKKEKLVEEMFGGFSQKDYSVTHMDKLKHLVAARERKQAKLKKHEEAKKVKLNKILSEEIKPKKRKKLNDIEQISVVEQLRAMVKKKKK